VARLRAYSMLQQRRLVALLGARGIAAEGGSEDRGAFLVIRGGGATALAQVLERRGVYGDARGEYLRLCPDVLTTDAELVRAADEVALARAELPARPPPGKR